MHRLNLKNLTTPTPATIAMWLLIAGLLVDWGHDVLYALKGGVVTFIPSTTYFVVSSSVLAFGVLAYFMAIWEAPSWRRWLFFAMIAILTFSVIYQMATVTWINVSYTVTVGYLANSFVGHFLVVCGPLVWLRIVAPPRIGRQTP